MEVENNDALVSDFEDFLRTSLVKQPDWSDMIIHGRVEDSEVEGQTWWRLPSGWKKVLDSKGDPEIFESSTLEYFLEQYRKNPTAFANGDSLRLAVSISDDFRLRVTFFTYGGRKDQHAMEIRRIRRHPSQIESLDVPKPWLNDTLSARKGLCLIVGPTASGKTSTCYSLLDYFNRHREAHILTIEDPVENILVSQKSIVTQTEIGPNGANFAAAMNGALVKAPNIILIGEIKDQDTAAAALQAGNSGHLVFGTLHVDSCETAVERLLSLLGDSPSARKELAATLRSVLGQALVPNKDGSQRILVCDALMIGDGKSGESYSTRNAVEQGSIGFLREAIHKGHNESRSMVSSLVDKVRSQQITEEDALNAATHQTELRAMLYPAKKG